MAFSSFTSGTVISSSAMNENFTEAQTQLDSKISKSTMTATGDLIYASGVATPARLGIGTSGQYLRVASGVPAWETPTLPTVQIFTTGSGTYTTPANVKWIRVRMVGGGGGGQGSSDTTWAAAAGNGGSSTFGSSLLTAAGGGGGNIQGGAAALATVNAPAVSMGSFYSSYGVSGQLIAATASALSSGSGAGTPFGGPTGGSIGDSAGRSATANTGAGGGGGSIDNPTAYLGAGGGSGAFVDAIIKSPSATYSYAVGAGGTPGAAGTNGYAGGAGAAGIIIVEEYY